MITKLTELQQVGFRLCQLNGLFDLMHDSMLHNAGVDIFYRESVLAISTMLQREINEIEDIVDSAEKLAHTSKGGATLETYETQRI